MTQPIVDLKTYYHSQIARIHATKMEDEEGNPLEDATTWLLIITDDLTEHPLIIDSGDQPFETVGPSNVQFKANSVDMLPPIPVNIQYYYCEFENKYYLFQVGYLLEIPTANLMEFIKSLPNSFQQLGEDKAWIRADQVDDFNANPSLRFSVALTKHLGKIVNLDY